MNNMEQISSSNKSFAEMNKKERDAIYDEFQKKSEKHRGLETTDNSTTESHTDIDKNKTIFKNVRCIYNLGTYYKYKSFKFITK